ncbi:hypothetical protein [Pseudofrankia asymbiotica]|uniref:hypothetical protein n=1 Tax=Pseudofrankia asymbiotica TaxID=1834516 RepID=UPI00097588DB|nr:hypothetical protein [Pseudofrankia asymbiotica]
MSLFERRPAADEAASPDASTPTPTAAPANRPVPADATAEHRVVTPDGGVVPTPQSSAPGTDADVVDADAPVDADDRARTVPYTAVKAPVGTGAYADDPDTDTPVGVHNTTGTGTAAKDPFGTDASVGTDTAKPVDASTAADTGTAFKEPFDTGAPVDDIYAETPADGHAAAEPGIAGKDPFGTDARVDDPDARVDDPDVDSPVSAGTAAGTNPAADTDIDADVDADRSDQADKGTTDATGATGATGAGQSGAWRQVLLEFVDHPREAVEKADRLVDDAVRSLTERINREHTGLRDAWHTHGEASTEDLRKALRGYRDFFEKVLNNR